MYGSGVSQSQFSNIGRLHKLESLKVRLDKYEFHESRLLQFLAFPSSIKRLTSIETRCLWEDMSIVGSLPNLEVLKLRQDAAIDSKWNPIEDQFEKLRYLELFDVPLLHWEADNSHFPRLEILAIKDWCELNEIPTGIGEIDSLKLIQVHCRRQSLVDSAKKIQDNQKEMGNEDLQVIVTGLNEYNTTRQVLSPLFLLIFHYK